MFDLLANHIAIFLIALGLTSGIASFYLRHRFFLSALSLSFLSLSGFINYSVIEAKLSLPQFVFALMVFSFWTAAILIQRHFFRKFINPDPSKKIIGTTATVLYNPITPSQSGTVRVENRILKARLENHISANIAVNEEVKITGLEGNIFLLTPISAKN